MLTETEATEVWNILTEVCDATNDYGFIHAQSTSHCPQWRFQGSLGFGGKFYQSHSVRPDGTFGILWHVSCYHEDLTDERQKTIILANSRLWDLQVEYGADEI